MRELQWEQENLEWMEQVGEQYWDDASGKLLDPEGVRQARAAEMGHVKELGVYRKVPIKQCWDRTGKRPIAVRWVDINKGDEINPDYRSRLVAKELRTNKREDLFAATPPLEAKKVLFSLAVTQGVGWGNVGDPLKLEFIDISRAFFHARARREIYVDLRPEDSEEGMCALLLKSLYGTRDAPQNWEYEYSEDLVGTLGFVRGISSPCTYYHEERNVRVVVHGDDFTALGTDEHLDWFRDKTRHKFLLKSRGRLGPEPQDDRVIRILNRVVEWTEDGIWYEADPRHVEIILRELGLQGKSKAVVTPGEKESGNPEKEGQLLSPGEATMYRALVARAIYLSQDRSDIQYAVKELSRRMSEPRDIDQSALNRLGRYLLGEPRVRTLFEYQGLARKLDTYVDTDYAGCRRTRKSTSGGTAFLGKHVIKSWSLTQSIVTLSSGEAEYYGLVKALWREVYEVY